MHGYYLTNFEFLINGRYYVFKYLLSDVLNIFYLFGKDTSVALILSQLGQIEPLDGTNYHTPREKLDIVFIVSEVDYGLQVDRPTKPKEGSLQYKYKVL